jgi:hypothetical protein
MALNVDRRVEGGSDELGGLGGLFLKIFLTQDLGMGQESKAKGTTIFLAIFGINRTIYGDAQF